MSEKKTNNRVKPKRERVRETKKKKKEKNGKAMAAGQDLEGYLLTT